MKPAPFAYHAPSTVAEAVSALGEHGDDAKVLAGGQSLVPMMALRLARPTDLIDVNGVAELAGVRREIGCLVVGATVRHASLERDPEIGDSVPLLRLAAPRIGHFQIRSRGTLGGSLAHADAAAELPAVARALDAEILVRDPTGERTIPSAEFFETMFTTVLEPNELLTGVRFPVWEPGSGFSVEEIARRHGDFALAGAVCAVTITAGRIERAALAMFGMSSVPERLGALEESLTGAAVDGLDLGDVGEQGVAALDPPSDVHATGKYRKKIGAVLIRRALSSAIQSALVREAASA
jgi:aerobic carbon-monoxide dehydrogenase medium subunit